LRRDIKRPERGDDLPKKVWDTFQITVCARQFILAYPTSRLLTDNRQNRQGCAAVFWIPAKIADFAAFLGAGIRQKVPYKQQEKPGLFIRPRQMTLWDEMPF